MKYFLLKTYLKRILVEMVCWEVQNCQLLYFFITLFCSFNQWTHKPFCSPISFNGILSHLWRHLSPCTQPLLQSAEETLPSLVQTAGSGKDAGSLAIRPATPTPASAIVKGDPCHLPPHSRAFPNTWESLSPLFSITKVY